MRARYLQAGEDAPWDALCAASHGATFLHSRRFLNYHGDRFADRSVVLEDDGKWIGVLPAAVAPDAGDTVVSHPGITFGGFVHRGALRGDAMVEAFERTAELLRGDGFRHLRYKAVPHIYHRSPAQDDLWALHRVGAQRVRADLSTTVDLDGRLPVSERRTRALRKAGKAGVAVDADPARLEALWHVIAGNLARKHGVAPVHSAAELRLLADRFPEQIGVRTARLGDDVVAGLVLFRHPRVVHAQYIASSESGHELAALDAVFDHAIGETRAAGIRFFDFGISTERSGTVLNGGLHRFKSEFGGSGVVHEFYDIDLEGRE